MLRLKFSVILFLVVLLVGCGENPLDGSKNSNPQVGIELPKEIIGSDGAPMVLIPAGEFRMGTDPSEVNSFLDELSQCFTNYLLAEFPDLNIDINNPELKGHLQEFRAVFEDLTKAETPAHKVFLDAFYIDVHEVTNAQYKKFVDATGYRAPYSWNISSKINAPNQPVVGVSWYDAKAYADWAGKRLPTEAEWEKSARGGLVGKKFPWGDQNPDGSQCNFGDKNALDLSFLGALEEFIKMCADDDIDDNYTYAAPVGSFTPNSFGLYDMAGNVSEWCADWCDSGYYANSPQTNPKGPANGQDRVLRGGSFVLIPFFCRVASRSGSNPNDLISGVGFRCAMDATK